MGAVLPHGHVRSRAENAPVLKKQDLPRGALEATHDRQGRPVVLRKSAMAHIAWRHPELAGCEVAITTAVENAEFRCRSKVKGREILYAANLGPARWLVVVVAYDDHGGSIITAYGSKRGPRTAELI